MLRHTFIGMMGVLGLAVSSQAGVIITRSDAPTFGLPGFTTVTLTATTDNGSQIYGFDFATKPQYGFFGPMNQLVTLGVFTDNNSFIPFFPGWDISQDSQFKFNSNTLTVPAGFATESNSHLRAVFASPTGWGTSVPFVQLAIPNAAAATVNFAGQIQTILGTANPIDNDVSGSIPVPVPEPAAVIFVGLAVAGCVLVRRERAAK